MSTFTTLQDESTVGGSLINSFIRRLRLDDPIHRLEIYIAKDEKEVLEWQSEFNMWTLESIQSHPKFPRENIVRRTSDIWGSDSKYDPKLTLMFPMCPYVRGADVSEQSTSQLSSTLLTSAKGSEDENGHLASGQPKGILQAHNNFDEELKYLSMNFFKKSLNHILHNVLKYSEIFREEGADDQAISLVDVYVFSSDRLRQLSKILALWKSSLGSTYSHTNDTCLDIARWYLQVARFHVFVGLDALAGQRLAGIDPKLVKSAVVMSSRNAFDSLLDYASSISNDCDPERKSNCSNNIDLSESHKEAINLLAESFALLCLLSLPLGLESPSDIIVDVNTLPVQQPSILSFALVQCTELIRFVSSRLGKVGALSSHFFHHPATKFTIQLLGCLTRGDLSLFCGLDPLGESIAKTFPYVLVSLISSVISPWATVRMSVVITATAMPKSAATSLDLTNRLCLKSEQLCVYLLLRVLKWPLTRGAEAARLRASKGLSGQSLLEASLTEFESMDYDSTESDTAKSHNVDAFIQRQVHEFSFPSYLRGKGWLERVQSIGNEIDGIGVHLSSVIDPERSKRTNFCEFQLRATPQVFGSTGSNSIGECDPVTLYAYLRALSIARWQRRLHYPNPEVIVETPSPDAALSTSFVKFVQRFIVTG